MMTSALVPMAGADLMRGNHFEHHGKHDGKDKPRADPLHRAPDERHGKRGGSSAHNCADEEGAEREHGEAFRAENHFMSRPASGRTTPITSM